MLLYVHEARWLIRDGGGGSDSERECVREACPRAPTQNNHDINAGEDLAIA